MECPQCKGYRLEPKELEAGLMVNGCPKCEGTLLSLINYRFWSDQQPEVEHATTDISIDDTSKAQLCPKCSRLMMKFRVGKGSDNRIDLCPACDEAWLDKGEWQLLKQLDLHEHLPKIFTDAWQRNIRLERQEKNQRERMQNLVGEADFEKISAFKSWLDDHPQKSRLLAYLMDVK